MSKHWLVKQEPSTYAWERLVTDAKTDWTGVRNYQARKHLRAMKVGDDVLYYHSVTGKAVVGLARVAREAFADPTDPAWVAVELVPVRAVQPPVTLEQIKNEPRLRNLALLRQPRLSVMPLTRPEFDLILRLSAEHADNAEKTKTSTGYTD
jgi:predicted RNA-binding protein with PUA-like domain